MAEYRLKQAQVNAEQVTEDARTVVTVHGVRTAQKGDYVVELYGTKNVRDDESGEVTEESYCRGVDIVPADQFESQYEPVKNAPSRKRKLPE